MEQVACNPTLFQTQARINRSSLGGNNETMLYWERAGCGGKGILCSEEKTNSCPWTRYRVGRWKSSVKSVINGSIGSWDKAIV